MEALHETLQLRIRLQGRIHEGEAIRKHATNHRSMLCGVLKEEEPHEPGQDHEELGVAILAHSIESWLGETQRLEPRDGEAQSAETRGLDEVTCCDLPTFLVLHEARHEPSVVLEVGTEHLQTPLRLLEVPAQGLESVDDAFGDDVAGIGRVGGIATNLAGPVKDIRSQIRAALPPLVRGRVDVREHRGQLHPRLPALLRHLSKGRLRAAQLPVELDDLQDDTKGLFLDFDQLADIAVLEVSPSVVKPAEQLLDERDLASDPLPQPQCQHVPKLVPHIG
mmetsp:Transcript_52461/g.150398  ORF Transcript_52461/g.150398 Transcript_52461/m.150398 type:complete len:279 (-) Transcript_52461:320-1156(-)